MDSMENLVSDFLMLMAYMRDNYFRPAELITRNRFSPMQFHALSVIRLRGPISMSELAGAMKVSKQQLTPLVCRLIDSGLVARKNDEYDRRVLRIQITETGLDVLVQVREELKQNFKEKLRMLPRTEQKELAQLLRRIHEILKIGG